MHSDDGRSEDISKGQTQPDRVEDLRAQQQQNSDASQGETRRNRKVLGD
jgi:hypothetical protein